MKTPINLLLIILFLSFNSCSQEDNCENPTDCLPPATQTGAGTFGCLINGEPFVDISGRFNCFYQLVDGKYYFAIGAEDNDRLPQNIYLSLNALELKEGKLYNLNLDIENSAYAGAGFTFSIGDSFGVYTNSQNTGEMKITKFDLEKRIVSGTFSFKLEHPKTGEIVKITNGRFDSLFTR